MALLLLRLGRLHTRHQERIRGFALLALHLFQWCVLVAGGHLVEGVTAEAVAGRLLTQTILQ